jgi:hypothetical protein
MFIKMYVKEGIYSLKANRIQYLDMFEQWEIETPAPEYAIVRIPKGMFKEVTANSETSVMSPKELKSFLLSVEA